MRRELSKQIDDRRLSLRESMHCRRTLREGAYFRGAKDDKGVTLVELLVAIMIMLLITAIAIPVLAPSMKNRDVREAARMIDVFINGARTRALQSGHSYGVMIERMPGQPNGAVTLSYCEQPDAYTGDYASAVAYPTPGNPTGAGSGGSTILLLGNGGFGMWAAPGPSSGIVVPQAFPKGDSGWIAGVAPNGTDWLTNIAPGDVVTANGTQYRIWAGEPFIDIDQNGVRNVTAAIGAPGYVPGTPPNVQEPFIDVDGDLNWTPPNYPGSPAFNPNQPYVDPGSGYFVQPAAATVPFPVTIWGSAQSARVTYAPFDPLQSSKIIGDAFQATVSGFVPYVFDSGRSSVATSTSPGFAFSFQRRPVKTSAPSIQLPGGAVIDLGANYLDQVYNPQNQLVVPVPGSGIEVLAANANALGFWSTFRAQPSLDPSVKGSLAATGAMPADPTSIMIMFQSTGTVDRIYSWSEGQMGSATGTSVSTPPNWSDWQGRIPAGPIYLLVARQGLINGDPDLLPLVPQNQAPLKPIYNVQDPDALWVAINPQTGAVATAENVGYDLTQKIPPNPDPTSPIAQNMPVYWAANVYYSRRIARSMLDMGGR